MWQDRGGDEPEKATGPISLLPPSKKARTSGNGTDQVYTLEAHPLRPELNRNMLWFEGAIWHMSGLWQYSACAMYSSALR